MIDREIDMPEIETIKIKRQIHIRMRRCLVCGKWELPEYDKDKYQAVIIGETACLCESCREAIKWAKDHKNGR